MKHFRVAILFNFLLFTEFEISSQGKEYSSLSVHCQWRTFNCKSRNQCIEQCAENEGFIIPGTNNLICFHDSKEASLIPMIDDETNKKQCGYLSRRFQATGLACKPKVICENEINEDQCWDKCSKYTVYVTRQEHKLANISYCGETSIIENLKRPLDAAGNQLYLPRNDGSTRNVYNCTCGFGEEGKEVMKPVAKRRNLFKRIEDQPSEMVASCPNIFLSYKKGDCEKSCRKLNGIYSREDEIFLCFHSQWNVTMFKSTADYCECGVKALETDKRTVSYGACPPERRIPLNTRNEKYLCPEKCSNYKAYVYSPNRSTPHTIYCETPSQIYENLGYEIGKVVIVDNKKEGNAKHRRYECKCGRVIPKQSETNSKPNNTSRNDERDNLQNNLYSDMIYDLIYDGEKSTNTDDFETPIVGRKRTSNRANSRNSSEINRSKGKAPEISEFVQPVDIEIPSMSCHHTASPSNTQIAGLSSVTCPKFDLNFKQIDDEMFRSIFTGYNYDQPSNSRQHAPTQNNVNDNECGNFSNNMEFSSSKSTTYNEAINESSLQNDAINTPLSMKYSFNRLQNTAVSQNLSEISGRNRDNTSQSIGVTNHITMRSNEGNAVRGKPDGSIYSTIQGAHDNIISTSRSLSRSPSSLFPDVTLEINDLINPVGDIYAPSMHCDDLRLDNIGNYNFPRK